MANIEAAVVTRLKANTVLNAAIGGRVFPHMPNQATPTPYIVYYGDITPEHEISGRCVGIAQYELTLEIYSGLGEGQVLEARSLLDKVRNVLDGYRGTVSVTNGQSVEQVEIRTCTMGTASAQMQVSIDGGEQGRAVQVVPFSIGYFETIPTPT